MNPVLATGSRLAVGKNVKGHHTRMWPLGSKNWASDAETAWLPNVEMWIMFNYLPQMFRNERIESE